MDGKKDIFQQFQDRQSAWDETPPASAWERLEARLDAEPPNHPGRPWRPFILPGLGMLFLFVFLGWGLLRGSIDSASSGTPGSDSFSRLRDQQLNRDNDPWKNNDQEQQENDYQDLQNEPDEQPLELLADGARVTGPQLDSSDLYSGVASDLGNPALEPMPYQRLEPAIDLEDLIPVTNVGAYNYDNTTLNPGNMVVTNSFGNILDTVGSISQYHNAISQIETVPGYLQMNASRNDISYSPRGGHRNRINPSALDHFNWLLGSWKFMGPSGGAISFEEWERKDAFNFEGRGYLVVNGDTLITDKMRIEQRGQNVYYIAALDTNQAPMRFRLRSTTPGEAVFKNPGRGFPNEVILRQADDGTLETNFNNGKTNPRKREEIIRNLRREQSP